MSYSMILDIIFMIEYYESSIISILLVHIDLYCTHTRNFLLLFNLSLIKRCSSEK